MKNKYNSISEETEVKTDTESLKKLMEELGISLSSDDVYNLILWNDDVNDMLYVINALSDICELSNDECVIIMLEAHEKGKSVAKSGSYDEMMGMKKSLNSRMINVTVEK